MNVIDHAIVGFLQAHTHQSKTFDNTVVFIDHSDLMKGGILMSVLWWMWFRRGKDRRWRRESVLAALGAGLVSVAVGHGSSHFMPFRYRPMHEPSLHFVLPYGASRHQLKLWSSFPSQHELFFAALAVGMMYINWIVGALFLAHSLIFVAFPRVYLGFHYPTDILGGLVIGAIVAIVMQHPRVRQLYAPRLLQWQARHPGVFYAVFFLVTLQLSSMFQGAIDLLKLIVLGPSVS